MAATNPDVATRIPAGIGPEGGFLMRGSAWPGPLYLEFMKPVTRHWESLKTIRYAAFRNRLAKPGTPEYHAFVWYPANILPQTP